MSIWVPGTSVWTLDLFVLVNIVGAAILYGVGRWCVRRSGVGWSDWHTLSFGIGLALLAFAYLGPFETLAHTFFWAHMSQHLIVMMIAAPLIVLSNPVALTVLATQGRTRATVIRALRSRAGHIAINPIVTWGLFATVLIGSHLTPVMEWVLNDHDAMAFVERPLYLIAALLFYYPLVGNDMCARRPTPGRRVLSLGLMMVPETMLGAVIFLAPVTLYPTYVAAAQTVGGDALFDQQLAGALMWALTMVLDSFWMMLAAIEWWRADVRQTALQDRREAAVPG